MKIEGHYINIAAYCESEFDFETIKKNLSHIPLN